MRFIYFILLCGSFCCAQHKKSTVIFDKDDKEPIEFVYIYNSKDYTISNEEGKFSFSSTIDSIYFYKLGYNKFQSTFAKTKDTIYLEKSTFELQEVIVTNGKTLFQKIKDSLSKNYSLSQFNEKFLLRGILKYNDSIVRIQDIQGKLRRKTLLYTKEMEISKKDYEVEITNMRKIGITKDDNKTYFVFPSFNDLFLNFVRINVVNDDFDLFQQPFDNGNKINWDFTSNSPDSLGIIKGNYILNAQNYAIESFELNNFNKNNPYTESGHIKYRTNEYHVHVIFSADKITGKYFIDMAKFKARVEITNQDYTFTSFYDMEFILTTSDNFKEMKVKSNVNENKDIFKLNYPYNQQFWNQENQLLLTQEMKAFISKMGKENNEFTIKSNLK